MRVLIIGARNPWRMEAALQLAMRRRGHDARIFDDRRLRRHVGYRLTQVALRRVRRRFRPDFVLLTKCHGLSLESVAELVADVPHAMWYHDPQWHSDLQRPDIAHIAAVGRMAHTFFVTGFTHEWRVLGLNARFLPAAGAREIIPVSPSVRSRSEASFIGTGYDPARARFLIELSRQVQVRVWGPSWEAWRRELSWNGGPVEGREFGEVCSSAACTLGILPSQARGATTYASDRMWMVILAGGYYLGPRAPGLDQMLIGGTHCGWYDDLADCAEQVREAVRNPVERERIRLAGECFVREHHTYDARVPFLLERREWVNPL